MTLGIGLYEKFDETIFPPGKRYGEGMKTGPMGARNRYDIEDSLVHLTKIQLHGGFNIQISYIKLQYVCTQRILGLLFQLVHDTDGHPRDGYQSHLYCIH